MKIPDPNPNLSDREFYLRSFTWGLPVNVGGAVVALGMLVTGHRPERYGNCINFPVGKGWGGGSLGVFLFTCRDATEQLKQHEHGHSIQNCYYGPLMPILVNLPSSGRYWYRRIVQRVIPGKKLQPYDSVWFERDASRLGREFMKNRKILKKLKKQACCVHKKFTTLRLYYVLVFFIMDATKV